MPTLTDRMIAPGASRGEMYLGYGTAIAGATLIVALLVHAELSPWRAAIVTLVAFDLFGGAVVNACDSAKNWYHRPGRTRVHHLRFVAVHIHPFLLAWAVPGFTVATAVTIYLTILIGGLLVTSAPAAMRRPVAFCGTAFGMAIVTSVLTVPHVVAWFAPVLLIKLLLAHLLPENAER